MTWWDRVRGDERLLVAYFSMEFGVDERLPTYAGGLGVLAGDHLKSASDLGVPLVGVGLLYRRGYFRQALEDGRQVERYAEHDPAELGLERQPVELAVELGGDVVDVAVWRTDVGRVPLLLLDAAGAEPTLYGGGREARIRQEVILGVGGVRALRALGFRPDVYHLNEGHAAFAALERLAGGEHLEDVRASTVFTTHTPVPAGNEVFDPELVRRELGGLVERAGLGWDRFAELGSFGEPGFGLTPLALRTAARANAVSALHADVSRSMWRDLWPEADRGAVPIAHVTNGVHPPTWVAPEVAALLVEAGVAPGAVREEAGWDAVRGVPAEAVRQAHAAGKRRLVERADLADADALTIGFARRFATYKRAGLLFADPERFRELPVQLVVAGKAHPADEPGKDLLARVVRFARDPAFAGRVSFLEDYDLALARVLVQGSDVWLNTPLRPLEASGTSGMKAALNGGLNLSVLDGWWAEGYDPAIGWAIEGSDDAGDAERLYRLLEHEVLPAWGGDVWATMMRDAIASVGARFSSARMVSEYVERFYRPAARGAHAPAAA